MLPSWLTKITGAMAFADPAKNGGMPTIGDALQGIGHDMMQHFRGSPDVLGAKQPTGSAVDMVGGIMGGLAKPPAQVSDTDMASLLGPSLGLGQLPQIHQVQAPSFSGQGPVPMNNGLPAQSSIPHQGLGLPPGFLASALGLSVR